MDETFNVGSPTKENIDYAFKNLVFYVTASTQLDIYKLYVDAFFEMQCKPEDLYKTNFVSQIYNLESNFFKSASNNENFLVFLNYLNNLIYFF